MSGPAINYQACSVCTAKWFGPAAANRCPRCGAATLPSVRRQPPWVKTESRDALPPSTLLESLPIADGSDVLCEAIGGAPPWSNQLVAHLHRAIRTTYAITQADHWRRVALVLQQPRRNSTQNLLNACIRELTPATLSTLLAHLDQRCRHEQLAVVDRIHRLIVRTLRHGDKRGLVIDPDGWVSTRRLLQRVNSQSLDLQLWRDWTPSDLKRQMDLQRCQRLQMNENGARVRARYGHSLPDVCPGKIEAPPPTLFHGTGAAKAEQILAGGFESGQRTFVHLTSNRDYATSIAERSAAPKVLQIDARRATSAGTLFWMCNSHVWQCLSLMSDFITTTTNADQS